MTVTHPSSRTRRLTQVRGESVLPVDPATDGGGAIASPFVVGVLAALQAVVVGLVALAVPTLLLALISPGGAASVLDGVRTAAVLWLAGHRTGLATGTGFVHLAPLGLTLAFAGCALWFARRAGRVLALTTTAASSPDGRALRTQLGFVSAYVLAGLAVALVTSSNLARPQVETSLPGLLVFSVLACAVPLWQHRVLASWREPAVTRVGAWLRAGLSSLAFLAALALLVLAVATFTGFSRISTLYDSLHPGAAGSFGLALVQLAVLPNIVAWLLSWFAGTGFQVGIGTTVSSSETVLGPLPALPVLGALPSPGTHPSWLPVAAAGLVVLAGVFGGRALVRWHQDDGTTGRARLLDVVAAAGFAGVVAALASWWTSGPLGGGVMAWWGIGHWVFPLLLAVEVALGMALAVLLEPVLARRSRR